MPHTTAPPSYSPETIEALNQAFDDVWRKLYFHVPMDDGIVVKELSTALSKTLADLIMDGVTDPDTLRRRALEHMVLRAR
jgi:hypothetical protein